MYTEIITRRVRLPSAKAEGSDAQGSNILTSILRRDGILTRYRRGEQLYRMGSRLDRVYLIESGLGAQTRNCRSGKRQVLDFVLKGSILAGQGGDSEQLSHSVDILTNTAVYTMSATSFRRCLEEDQSAQAAWSDLVEECLQRAYGHLTNMGCHQGLERMCYLLAELDHRLKKAGEPDKTAIPIRQIDLADAAGITSVYVNQNLKKLEVQGAIEVKKGKIVILNGDYIAELSGYRK